MLATFIMFLRNHYVKRSLHNGFAKPLRKPAFFFFFLFFFFRGNRHEAAQRSHRCGALGGGLRRQDVHPHDDKSAHLLVQFLLPRLYLVAAEEYVQSSENHPTGMGCSLSIDHPTGMGCSFSENHAQGISARLFTPRA